jgi:hypothetical protein
MNTWTWARSVWQETTDSYRIREFRDLKPLQTVGDTKYGGGDGGITCHEGKEVLTTFC